MRGTRAVATVLYTERGAARGGGDGVARGDAIDFEVVHLLGDVR
jgi:hypothetical protein